jgi:hypothetical protein
LAAAAAIHPGKARRITSIVNPLHLWIDARPMSHRKPPEPGQAPYDAAFLAVQSQSADSEIGVAFQRRK